MQYVLDSHALLTYLEKETGWEKVRDIFTAVAEKDKEVLMTTVNWGEIYYIVTREYDYNKANEVEQIIHTLPIEIVDVDINIAREAARLKAGHKLSYADCFAAGLAKLKKAELITGDKEFKAVEGKINILWI